MWSEAFVRDEFVSDFFVRLAGTFFDRAFDGIAVDGSFPCFFNRGGEARVQIRIRSAELGRDHNFTNQFDDQLAFLLRVGLAAGLFPLCAHSGQSVWESGSSGSMQNTSLPNTCFWSVSSSFSSSSSEHRVAQRRYNLSLPLPGGILEDEDENENEKSRVAIELIQ